MNQFHLEVVTPERKVVSRDVYMIVAKAQTGEIGILAGHSPLVATLDVGVLRIKEEDQGQADMEIAVHGGFMDVTPDHVVILAEAAEFPEEIDVDRAEAARRRAEERLAERQRADVDYRRAELALRRSLNRLQLAQSRKK